MLDFHSETHTATNGAKVEVGTVSFQGRDFSAMGSVVDEKNGIWRCHTIFNCEESCPKSLRPNEAIAQLKIAALKDSI